MISKRIGGCHSLEGSYKDCYAMNLDHPYRLIIKPILNEKNELSKVEIVEIQEIIDYHNNKTKR